MAPRIVGDVPFGVRVAAVLVTILAGWWLAVGFSDADVYMSHIFDRSDLTRAAADLLFISRAPVIAYGFGLLLLAIGIYRQYQVAQYLICYLSGTYVLSILLVMADSSSLAGSAIAFFDIFSLVVVLSLSLLIILVLTVPSDVRVFFDREQPVPVGVMQVAVLNSFQGYLCAVEGILLALSGALGNKIVWFGVGIGLIGLMLVATGAGLRSGSSVARYLSLALYVGAAAISSWYGHDYGAATSILTLVPIGFVVIAAAGLFIPESSREWFTADRSHRTISRFTVVTAGTLLVALIISVIVGFTSHTVGPFR